MQERVLLVELVDLDGQEVVFGDPARFPNRSLTDGRKGLSNGVRYATEDL